MSVTKTFSYALLHSLLLFFSYNQTALSSEPDGSSFKIEEIADGIYIHHGVHVHFDHEQHDDIANVGFIVGDNCIAVIDTGGSVKVAKAFKQSIKQISDKPICYVINSHVHFDHVLGNVVFKEEGTQFVGHINLADGMESNREFFVSEFKEDLAEYAQPENIIAPTILVEDTMELDLGNRIITLKAQPTAHTHTDLSVYDENSNTLWLADLIFVEHIPVLDGSLKGWLKVMEEVAAKDYNLIIPGHGSVTSSSDGMKAQENYLTLLLESIRAKINEGAFMEDIVETVGEEEKKKWLLHEQHHKRNVTKAFSELEWE